MVGARRNAFQASRICSYFSVVPLWESKVGSIQIITSASSSIYNVGGLGIEKSIQLFRIYQGRRANKERNGALSQVDACSYTCRHLYSVCSTLCSVDTHVTRIILGPTFFGMLRLSPKFVSLLVCKYPESSRVRLPLSNPQWLTPRAQLPLLAASPRLLPSHLTPSSK